jgi:PEP-CTERM motif
MRRGMMARLAVGCGLLLGCASSARAELIAWSYNTFVFPSSVQPDGSPGGPVILPVPGPTFPSTQVSFTPAGGTVAGSSRILLANLQATSSAAADSPDRFKQHPFSLTVGILDQVSNRSGLVTFQGTIDGTLSSQSANLTVDFGTKTRSLHLGRHVYEIKIDQMVAPGVPNPGYIYPGAGYGAIGAKVTVRNNPEPGSLLLLGVGVPALGLVYWRRRGRAAGPRG